MARKIWWFVKVCFGFGSVDDGSICWFSRNFWDLHDYLTDTGGDGEPTHFYTYTCRGCGKPFSI